MVHRPNRLLVSLGFLVVVAQVALLSPSATANGGQRLAYGAACADFTVSLTTLNTATGIGLTTGGREACTYAGVRGNGKPEPPETRWLKFYSAPLSAAEREALCSSPTGVTPTSDVDIAADETAAGDLFAEGGATFRVVGGSLEVNFFWETTEGARILGVGTLHGTGCGVGSSWTGAFSVLDPNATAALELVQDLVGA